MRRRSPDTFRRYFPESPKIFLRAAVPEKEPTPGAIIVIQTFGDFLGFNPHCHTLVTDGCFYGSRGMFHVAPPLELKKLDNIFRQKIYEVDPLACPKCQGAMLVIGSIEDPSVIRTILEHLGLWLARARPPPRIHDPPFYGTGRSAAPSSADDVSQIPPPSEKQVLIRRG